MLNSKYLIMKQIRYGIHTAARALDTELEWPNSVYALALIIIIIICLSRGLQPPYICWNIISVILAKHWDIDYIPLC